MAVLDVPDMNMAPFAFSTAARNGGFGSKRLSNVVTINVGGQLFQTTRQTLDAGANSSFISQIVESSSQFAIPFVDRDPELFSIILSLLRTGNLPSRAKSFDFQDLLSEARFYGIESFFVSIQSNPSHFEAFNLQNTSILSLNGRDCPSAISTSPIGSLHVAHGSKITSFDWYLERKKTVLTQFTAIDSLLAISPSIAAAGATDFSGLQILDLEKGTLMTSLNWENATKSCSTVQGIGSSPDYLFTSFESGRRNSNTIMVYDLGSFLPVMEIAHNEIYGADLDSAIPATKLNWVPGYNLLMASGSHSGPSGVSGNVKLWDLRSRNAVFQINEKSDCFSDVTVSDSFSAIIKVGVNSGEVFYSDLRKFVGEDPWICLGENGRVTGKKEGVGCKIESHGSQVFCSSKRGDIGFWSEVLVGSEEDGLEKKRVFCRNSLGKEKGGGCGITQLKFGGNKMFVTRKDQQYVEVWQSRI